MSLELALLCTAAGCGGSPPRAEASPGDDEASASVVEDSTTPSDPPAAVASSDSPSAAPASDSPDATTASGAPEGATTTDPPEDATPPEPPDSLIRADLNCPDGEIIDRGGIGISQQTMIRTVEACGVRATYVIREGRWTRSTWR